MLLFELNCTCVPHEMHMELMCSKGCPLSPKRQEGFFNRGLVKEHGAARAFSVDGNVSQN
jgi:hypothetical protein